MTKSSGKGPASAEKELSSKKFQEIDQSNTKASSRQSLNTKEQSNSKGFGVQQTLMQSLNKSKIPPKSVDKDQLDSANRNEGGKISSQSDNIVYTSAKGTSAEKKKEAEKFDMKKNLSAMLDDPDTTLSITAQRTKENEAFNLESSAEKGSKKSSRKGTPRQILREPKQSHEKSAKNAVGSEEDTDIKVEEIDKAGEEENRQNQSEEETKEQTSYRKEYSVYEDWRILESVDHLASTEGPKALTRSNWGKLIDPLTGRKIFDGNRSIESLRDRYKRYIGLITEAEKKMILDFAASHSPEEMKQHFCTFKKNDDGEKKLVAISKQLNFNPERLQRKTPYGTKLKKEDEKKVVDKKKGRVEESFEEEKNDLDVNLNDIEENILDEIEELNESQLELRQKDGEDVETKDIIVSRPEKVETRGNSKLKTVSMTSTSMPEEKLATKNARGYNTSLSRELQEQNDFSEEEKLDLGYNQQNAGNGMNEETKKSKKRGAAQYGGDIEAIRKEMKRVRLDDDYLALSLQTTDVFKDRKPIKEQRDIADDLMIYVDFSKGFRQFVKQEIEEENPNQIKLNQICQKYNIPLNEIVVIFKKVSNDFGDLENYLENKDTRILWNEEEDKDLLENDPTAIKYLKKMKGEASIKRRRDYLLEHLK